MKNGSDRFGFAVYAALATLAVTLAWALATPPSTWQRSFEYR